MTHAGSAETGPNIEREKMMLEKDCITLKNCKVGHEMDAAVLICTAEAEEVWIPLSQVEKIVRRPAFFQDEITMTRWIANKKGIS